MSWLKKLFPSGPNAQSERFSVRTVSHTIETLNGDISCWTYITSGMDSWGQPELVFTLFRDANSSSSPPIEPQNLFSSLWKAAGQGNRFIVGGYTMVRQGKFYNRNIVYVNPLPLPIENLPANYLTVVLATDNEVKLAAEFGVTRLMSQLGYQATYFPCPPWSDPRRKEIDIERLVQRTIIASGRRCGCLGIYVNVADGNCAIRFPSTFARQLDETVQTTPQDSSLTLITTLDPAADGLFVWTSNSAEPQAISPPGSMGECISACFLLVCPNQPTNEMHLIEDGVSLLITAATWNELKQGIRSTKELNVQMDSGVTITLGWY